MDIVEVHEHQEIEVPLERLLVGGELALDHRISQRGYLSIAIAQGHLKLRATRFIGVIPINNELSVRITPAASIGSLSQMIVRAGSVPTVVEGFAQGYKPLFEQNAHAIELHHKSFLAAVEQIIRRGLLKKYVRNDNPPRWRGRLLPSATINRYVARGIRYAASFDVTMLSSDISENRIIKTALVDIADWLAPRREPAHRSQLHRATMLLSELHTISTYNGPRWHLSAEVPQLTRFLPPHSRHYDEALWSAYAILQRQIPDVIKKGYVSLDSLIVDVSAVFESYVRVIAAENAINHGYTVRDGNQRPRPFFVAGQSGYIVKPDILIEKAGKVAAIIDVKYKPKISEQDRYELLSFMDATGAQQGAFVCPMFKDSEQLKYLGKTPSGKAMSVIKIDLAAPDMATEEQTMATAMLKIANEGLGS